MSSLEYDLKPTDKVLFLHIPKTGGLTLSGILEQQFDRNKIALFLFPSDLPNIKICDFGQSCFFRGHVPYSVMTKILKTDPICLTMLRDPVEQYISTYAQLQRKELNSYIAKINLPKFIDNAPSQLLLHKINMRNRQSRMLAASYKFQDTTEMLAATSNYDSTRRPFLLNQELQITAKQLLPQAKSRLVNIAFFGLTERFRDSILNQKL